ncbi:MFS transporter [Actinoplanes sp. NPDC049265]|uniref:MFS transporter n=1 Tax=Actinoplanes sp. NPDC049265 TaxID=3363902 RepID=UPI00371ECC0B
MSQISTDVYGRRYRVGESDVELLGRPRIWIRRAAWASMAAVSLFQYGYAAALPAFVELNGWTTRRALLVLAVWVFCQAGSAAPAAWLYRRSGRNPELLLLVAAALCAAGLISLAHENSGYGYAIYGGLGTGLAYVVSIGAVTEWFPERIASASGAVSGAFGYGALPFILIAGLTVNRVMLDVTAVVVAVVLVTAALLIRRPPPHWWPSHLDPHRWAVDRSLNNSIPNNRPALRHFSFRAALRSGVLPVLFVVVVLTSVMAFFDIAMLATGRWPAVSIAVLAVSTGLGRWLSSRLSDRLGRRRTLAHALMVGALAQFVLLASHGNPIAVVLAGFGTGAGYSLLIGLVRDWFGDEATLSNYGVVYTGKAVGGVLGIILATGQNAWAVAGGLGLVAALLAYRLRQPGRPLLTLPR